LEAVEEAVANGASFSEIAVLVRSNAIGEDVAMYLISNGIHVITDDSLRVKSSITVRRLASLMSLIDNPNDTVNGYLAESLDVRIPQGCSSLVDMAEALLRELKEGDKDGLWKGETLHIQSFMDHVQEYEASKGNSLRGFLKFWEDENPSVSSPSAGDSVRVMTIHKSKGLDFPYVIIPFAENINLYKAGRYWCVPELSETPLEDVADGVYDVTLSRSSEHTLFSEDFRKESFLQQVDNINTIYVAMTRAALGMHVISSLPSAKCMTALDSGDLSQFSDFSQMLYWFASASCGGDVPGNEELLPPFEILRQVTDDGVMRFDIGTFPDFAKHRRVSHDEPAAFVMDKDDELPSIALNPQPDEDGEDVRERGRLKFSADSIDFFSSDGEAGMAASNRIKGVVLHEVLSRMVRPSDLDAAVNVSLLNGDIVQEEAAEIRELLSGRLDSAVARGWFPDKADKVLNEASLIDTDGRMLRPDRVVISDGKVIVVDYKFGEHHTAYERQLRRYSDIWRRMGYKDVSAFLWYVHTDEVREV
jgi:ATP-dependent exoDNAse (exonuclease V) beta subunit